MLNGAWEFASSDCSVIVFILRSESDSFTPRMQAMIVMFQ